MAKSKFPGKPQKTSQITRLRVSTNGNGSANDSSRFAAQQAAYGLKLFYQHFAADDEVSRSRPFASCVSYEWPCNLTLCDSRNLVLYSYFNTAQFNICCFFTG